MKRPDKLERSLLIAEAGMDVPAEAMAEVCAYALALEADHRAMREACSKLHHWHCWGIDEEGMVVSAESVRGIWNTLAALRVQDIPPLAEERKTNDSK